MFQSTANITLTNQFSINNTEFEKNKFGKDKIAWLRERAGRERERQHVRPQSERDREIDMNAEKWANQQQQIGGIK